MSEIQEGVITDKAVLGLFEDFPFKEFPSVISDYYIMLENLRGVISVELEKMPSRYNSPKYFVAVVEDDFRKEEQFPAAAGWDVMEYSLVNSIVIKKRGFFSQSEPLIVDGVVVVENNLFDDYIEIVCPSIDMGRALTDADFEGHEKSLEVTVLNFNFAENISRLTKNYAEQHGFPKPIYHVE